MVVADLLLYKYPVTGQGVDSEQSSDQPVLQRGRCHITVVDEHADGGLGSRRRRRGGALQSLGHLDGQQHARGRGALLGAQLGQAGALQQAGPGRQLAVVSEQGLLAVRRVLQLVLVHLGE